MRLIAVLVFLVITGCDNAANNIALGTLERDRIAHTATANEIIVALPIPQGSVVKQGMLLVKLDDQLQKAQLAIAAANVAKAEANLEKLRHGARKEELASARATVQGAKSALAESESNYSRQLSLKNQQLVSQSALDKALATRNSHSANLQTAQEALLLLTNGSREEDLRAAEAELNAAIAQRSAETKRLSDLSVVATRDGILDNLPWNLGERVTIGSPLAIILAGKAPHARVYVPEPHRVKLNVGDSLIVHVDGIAEPITGQLSWIASEPAFTPYYALSQSERARLMYLAEVQLPDSYASLPNGIPAQVELP
ncbi:HlyD family efflux transporter periplasmic adaptor subunit [Dasania marina]|uniref:HlyD family secretion protein n=1 Tax=Dasania marina TaxID=471499 RepID=UPI0030D6F131|tara:strand:- start:62168 stop:63106 length:939 start_codon:yes stop_codon:yes gene_type:complete